MKHVLLIGGEGYIGNVVSDNLLSSGFNVTSFDNLLYENNLCILHKIHHPNYQFIYGNMLNSDKLKSALENMDVVILLAICCSFVFNKKLQSNKVIYILSYINNANNPAMPINTCND